MAFGGMKGELVVVVDCGMNRLHGTKLVSNVREFGIRYDAFLGRIR